MNAADTPFLAIDVETTGLDPARHKPLELGLALITPDLDVAARTSWIIPWRPESLLALRRDAGEHVDAMHETSGLWRDCAETPGNLYAMMTADALPLLWPGYRDVMDWVGTHAPHPGIPLLGSSVHFDAHWAAAWFPCLLHTPEMGARTHRLADISAVRELLTRWAPHIVRDAPGSRKLHRVDPDLDDTLAEARHYRDALGLTWTNAPEAAAS